VADLVDAAMKARNIRPEAASDIHPTDEASASAHGHASVLLEEALNWLAPRSGGRYVDCTAGLGGHLAAILERSGPDGRALGIDLDADALGIARRRLSPFGDRVVLAHDSFRSLARLARWHELEPVDGVLVDLGVSSLQLDAGERGFSFRGDAPLDMRFNRSEGRTAGDLVATLTEPDLASLLFRFGEEPRARAIARAIVAERDRVPVVSTGQLARLVERVVGRSGRVHPATRTFQALRIAVNEELEALEAVLPQALEMLAVGGRLVVISFHSLEDRIVKRFMFEESRDCICPPEVPVCVCSHRATLRRLTRSVVTASSIELAANPRARSAKLRVAERI
jgi:16S rRNA (cytosine1402-N4)-methyltransferase